MSCFLVPSETLLECRNSVAEYRRSRSFRPFLNEKSSKAIAAPIERKRFAIQSPSQGLARLREAPSIVTGRHSLEVDQMASMKETAERFFDACETGKGWAGCQQYCHPGATFSAQAGALTGVDTLEEYTAWMKGLLTPVPDGRYEVRSFAVDEGRRNVAAYGVFRGTHTGNGGPVPPTGKRVEADYVYVMQFDGDRIRHMTKIWNDGISLKQLGWMQYLQQRSGHMNRHSSSVALGFGVVVASVIASLHAQNAATSRTAARPALFTEAQVKTGEAVYTRACASCHGRTLAGGTAPPLSGPAFGRNWRDPRVTLDDLFFVMRTTMPPRQSNALSADERIAVFAYILNVNEYPAGPSALATDLPTLKQLHLEVAATATAAVTAEPPSFIAGAPGITAASGGPDQAALNAAGASTDWLVHNHDYSGSRYSPLDQITAANASRLAPVCVSRSEKPTTSRRVPSSTTERCSSRRARRPSPSTRRAVASSGGTPGS